MSLSCGCRIGLILVIVLHTVGLGFVLSRQVDFLFNDASHRIGPATDFRALYTAGEAWREGEGLYGQGPGFGYRYHPFTAMTIFAALSYLPLKAAHIVWITVSELLLVAALFTLRKQIPDARHFAFWVVGTFLASPLYLELYMGNATLAAVSLLIVAYGQFSENRSITATILFIVSCLVKPIGLFLLPLIMIKRRAIPALATVGMLAILALPYLMSDPENCAQVMLVNCTDQTSSPGFLVHAGNQGLHALLARIGSWQAGIPLTSLHSVNQLSPVVANLLTLWPYLLISLATLFAWRFREEDNASLMIGVFLLTFICAYKEIWEHSYVAVVLVTPLLWGAGTVNRKAILIGFAIVALPTAFAAYDIPYDGNRLHDPDWEWSVTISLLHHATKPTGAIILLSAAVIGVANSRRKGRAQGKNVDDISINRTRPRNLLRSP